jgi:hypothetical protein
MIVRWTALGLLLVALVGCGNGKPPTLPVTGKVIFAKNKPAVGALVVFHPKEAAREKQIGGKPFGKVDESGNFTLTTYAENDGAPEGEYAVTIDWRAAASGKLSLSGEGASGKPLLKAIYSDPTKPTLSATVRKGEANTFTFGVD